MELIHSGADLVDIRQISNVDDWDAVPSLGSTEKDNDFQLIISETVWNEAPIEAGHYLYEPGTEYGGRVEGVKHVGSQVYLSGYTWRGMLSRKIICPPGGSAYKTITAVEANNAISQLVGSSMGALYSVSLDNSGITVSGSFRYVNLLSGIQSMLKQYGARLKVVYADGNVTLSAVAVRDLTDSEEFSQDYSAPIETEYNEMTAYNHIIALGSGELTARQVVELWRLDDGTITDIDPVWSGIDDKQTTLDYPNVESLADLTAKATEKLIEYSPTNKIQIDLDVAQGLELGDIVGGRDYITGQTISKPITQIIRKVTGGRETITYKVGDDQ